MGKTHKDTHIHATITGGLKMFEGKQNVFCPQGLSANCYLEGTLPTFCPLEGHDKRAHHKVNGEYKFTSF